MERIVQWGTSWPVLFTGYYYVDQIIEDVVGRLSRKHGGEEIDRGFGSGKAEGRTPLGWSQHNIKQNLTLSCPLILIEKLNYPFFAQDKVGFHVNTTIYILAKTFMEGTQWRSWLRHCATSRKVAGSIPDGATSGRTMAWSRLSF